MQTGKKYTELHIIALSMLRPDHDMIACAHLLRSKVSCEIDGLKWSDALRQLLDKLRFLAKVVCPSPTVY